MKSALKFLVALVLCAPLFGETQTHVRMATPSHPEITIPVYTGVEPLQTVTVSVKTTLVRDFVVMNRRQSVSVLLNAPGSYETCVVHSPWGGLLATQQGVPFQIQLLIVGPNVHFDLHQQQLFQSVQSTAVNPAEYTQGHMVTMGVDFAGQFTNQYAPELAKVLETTRLSAEVVVTYSSTPLFFGDYSVPIP